MHRTQIECKVMEVVENTLGLSPGELKIGSSFEEDLGADSLLMTEVFINIEDTFSIELPEGDLENLKTVQDVVTYILENVAV